LNNRNHKLMIKSLYEFLFNKTTQFFLISFSLFLLLKNPVELLLNNTIVKYIFENIDYKWYFDLILLGVLFVAFILTWHRYKIRYIPSKGITYGLTVIVTIYSFYRFFSSQWVFEPLQSIPSLKYFDTIFFIFICQIILHFSKEKQPKTDNEGNSFLNDKPILKVDDEKLGYNTYAAEIGNKILSSHFDKSFAIGINGQWGDGKSSFINLIKKKVKGDDIIEVNFNPWDNHSPEAIIKNFFEEIQDAVRPYHSSLSRLFTQYSDKLLELESNTFTRSIQTFITTLTDFDSEDGLYEEINAALKDIDKKLVVYIDDLDRLDSKEIIEVIRLIRNTADFYNTFFVVAYDRNYLIEALKKYNHYKEEKFLEKIFQLEITLPYFDKKILKFFLTEKLKEKLPHELHKEIDNNISNANTIHGTPNILDEWLDNMRDVTRLSNSLLLNINTLISEVDFNDFVRIELIRLKYPSAYELLHQEFESFFSTTGSQSGGNYLKLRDIDENQKSKYEQLSIYKKYHVYLHENCGELSIPQKEVHKIVKLVDRIFSGDRYSSSPDRRSPLSIIHPSKFQRYFKYSLVQRELSYVEFDKVRMKSQDEFNKEISDWVDKGMVNEVEQRFYQIKTFDNKDDFEKIIRAIFYLANLLTNKKLVLVYNDAQNLLNKITGYVSNYQENDDEKQELKIFVQSLFQNALSPFTFESSVLRQVSEGHNMPSFILNENEVKEMSINYLKKYLEDTPELNRNTWHLYYQCYFTDWTDIYNPKGIVPDEAKNIMLELILGSELDNYLKEIIKSKSFEIGWYAVSKTKIEGLFDDWKSFEKILNEKNEADYKYLQEFKDFYAKFADTDYKNYVEYEFKDIPLSRNV